jgi:D-alanyl-D-alanine carboxypeptidase/D-alanyl-D-alanine-endopeptidase (penicillin-binding protein 4)
MTSPRLAIMNYPNVGSGSRKGVDRNESRHTMMHKIFYVYLLAVTCLLSACSTQQRIIKKASYSLINDPALKEAHVGILIQDADKSTPQYSYQSKKLFTPASNVKIISCYAAMKYLPEQLPAAIVTDIDTAVIITPTGDPTFLHPDFQIHPLFEKLRSINKPMYIVDQKWNSPSLGPGWSWDDYNYHYMAERSAFPIYGNLIKWFQEKSKKENPSHPGDTTDIFVYSIPDVTWPVNFGKPGKKFSVERDMHQNKFTIYEGEQSSASSSIPFITNRIETALVLLRDTLHKDIIKAENDILSNATEKKKETIYSQSTDSLLKKMMYRSDNFYADQSLEMVSQLTLQKMDESAIIKHLLSNDLSGISTSVTWVDGSGLSRYNQFSPADMVFVLNKLKTEFPWERISNIFPIVGTGNSSSTSGNIIYAKSGSMRGIYCLSGYVFTKKKKWLSFSIMINDHASTASELRRKVVGVLEDL